MFLRTRENEAMGAWDIYSLLQMIFLFEFFFFFNNMKDCTLDYVLATVTDFSQWGNITVSTFIDGVPLGKSFC